MKLAHDWLADPSALVGSSGWYKKIFYCDISSMKCSPFDSESGTGFSIYCCMTLVYYLYMLSMRSVVHENKSILAASVLIFFSKVNQSHCPRHANMYFFNSLDLCWASPAYLYLLTLADWLLTLADWPLTLAGFDLWLLILADFGFWCWLTLTFDIGWFCPLTLAECDLWRWLILSFDIDWFCLLTLAEFDLWHWLILTFDIAWFWSLTLADFDLDLLTYGLI